MKPTLILFIFILLTLAAYAEEPLSVSASQHKRILKMVTDYHRKNPSLLVCEEVSDQKAGAMVCKKVKVEIAIVPNEVADTWK